MIVVIAALAGAWQERTQTQAVLVALYVAGAWLLPLSLGPTLAFARAESMLLPAVVLFRTLPLWVVLLLVLVSTFVFQATAVAFFVGLIV